MLIPWLDKNSFAVATDTPATLAGTGAEVDNPSGTRSWANPSYACPDNDVYAVSTGTTSGVTYSEYLYLSNFGFSTWVGATDIIDGIKVVIHRMGTTNYITDDKLYLIDSAGTIQGSNKADTVTYWPSTEGTATYGSTSDTWSAGLDATDIRSSNFGIYLATSNGRRMPVTSASVDCVYITITYHTPRAWKNMSNTAYSKGYFRFANTPAWKTLNSSINLYERYNAGDDAADLMGGTYWDTQTFTIGNTGTNAVQYITGVKLKMYKSGTPGTLTVGIRATDVNGKPTGSNLASGTLDGTTMTASSPGAWYWINFTTPYPLQASTKYSIVCSASGTQQNAIYWRADITSPSYSGGSYGYSTNSGSTWTLSTSTDFMFEVYSKLVYSGYFRFGNTPAWKSITTGYFRFSNSTGWRSIATGYFRFGNTPAWKSIATGYFRFGNTPAWKSITTGYFRFGNTPAWASFSSGYFNFSNTPSWQGTNGYFTFGNVSANHTISEGYFNFSNTPSWSGTEGYFSFNNSPVWQGTDGYFNFSNSPTWQGTDGYFTFGNVSTNQIISEGYFAFNNGEWKNVTNGYFTFTANLAWTNTSEGYFTFGNSVNYMNISQGYFNFSNTPSWHGTDKWFSFANNVVYNNIDQGWFSFENITAWQNITQGYFNFSNNVSWQNITQGNFTFGNGAWQPIEQGYFTFTNISTWQTLTQGYFTFGNTSYMIIVSTFPADGDIICPTCYENDTFFYFNAHVDHFNGTLMNITWKTWNGTLLGQVNNVGNGTWHIVPFETIMPIIYGSAYNYTINVTDGATFIEKVITFSTDTYTNCMMSTLSPEQFSAIIMLALFMFLFWVGYMGEKRSAGAFMLISGLVLIGEALVAWAYLPMSFGLLLVALGIFISLLGINKWLIKPNIPQKGEAQKPQ